MGTVREITRRHLTFSRFILRSRLFLSLPPLFLSSESARSPFKNSRFTDRCQWEDYIREDTKHACARAAFSLREWPRERRAKIRRM